MNEPDPRDPDLDAAYRDTPRDQPPAEVDERIRAAAQRAVDARPQPLPARAAAEQRRSPLARWRVPLSIAATVVLAVTVALMIEDEERRPRYDTPVRTDSYASPAPSPADASDREAAPALEQPAKKNAESSQPASPPLPARAEALREQSARESAPPPAPASTAAPASKPIPAPAPMRDEAAKAKLPSAPSDAESAEPLRRDRALGERPPRAAREAASSPASARSPEEWIEAIRRLKADGLDAEAAAQLAEFRDRYPDYQLPPELR